ncbi:MAG: bifunctional aldolase/short-chain dehydrogenase [Verrucomicrobia bacterium]|nr:bifunctional aldolase/short-chain dehydrogenase [Verrucomicrobiota bacterium]
MNSLWSEEEAQEYPSELGQRVYTSRLLGRDPSLVLHGGGNTSVKLRERNPVGDEVELLYVKGSGWDLATIEEEGFAPVRMDLLLKLGKLDALTDLQMANELRCATVRANAPAPSVEAILHSLLPAKYVDHTHADAFISISNTPSGSKRVQEAYGDLVVYVPYVMPGFALARSVARLFPEQVTSRTIGLVLEHHGLFSFGETARESYERMVRLVTLAEDYLRERRAWEIELLDRGRTAREEKPLREMIAGLRQKISAAAGEPVLVVTHRDSTSLQFARNANVGRLAVQGPATPDHVVRTKRVPMVGRDVEAYVAAYTEYFQTHAKRSPVPLQMLDPAPRVVLDPELGLLTAGRTAGDAGVASDIYRHTIEIIKRAVLLEGWHALPAGDIFDVEYWELEQAKLRREHAAKMFEGEIALVTGAASGIGKACVEEFLGRGAAVIGLDLNPAIAELSKSPAALGVVADVTDRAAVGSALEQGVRRFGGLDMLVLNAGTFPPSRKIGELGDDLFEKALRVNLGANLTLLREAFPLLRTSPKGGRAVINGSKNVPAPGPGQAAYSASKAALTQLGRIAALEWGQSNIRVNIVHPNAVFDTGIWTLEVIQQRAASYGITVDDYKRNNVLRAEVRSQDVARVVAELCGPNFAKTTGAQIPVDGGNERVI